MTGLEISPHLVTVIAKSMMFRTFARIYENEFGVPLFFESCRNQETLRTPANESSFCIDLNRGDGCCTRCVCGVFPPTETLMPWTWSSPCHAGMRVTMIPILVWNRTIAWLITGHYFISEETSPYEELPPEALDIIGADPNRLKTLSLAFSEKKSIPRERHEQMIQYLETCSALLGADMNRFLLDDRQAVDDPAEIQAVGGTKRVATASETRVQNDEMATRARLENARRRLLKTTGQDEDIEFVAKDTGWSDGNDFERDFQDCFGESPSDHWKRVTALQRTFSGILTGSDRWTAAPSSNFNNRNPRGIRVSA
jgi:hypothetical protein